MDCSEEYIAEKWSEVDGNIEKALAYIAKSEIDMRRFIADCCASLCDVGVKEMLADTDVVYLAHARWLFWYAYRYMTNESYEKIALSTSEKGHSFSLRTIQNGVNKMSMMIASEPMWTKRWTIIKRIIKLREKEEPKRDNTITISVPRHLKDVINIRIIDK